MQNILGLENHELNEDNLKLFPDSSVLSSELKALPSLTTELPLAPSSSSDHNKTLCAPELNQHLHRAPLAIQMKENHPNSSNVSDLSGLPHRLPLYTDEPNLPPLISVTRTAHRHGMTPTDMIMQETCTDIDNHSDDSLIQITDDEEDNISVDSLSEEAHLPPARVARGKTRPDIMLGVRNPMVTTGPDCHRMGYQEPIPLVTYDSLDSHFLGNLDARPLSLSSSSGYFSHQIDSLDFYPMDSLSTSGLDSSDYFCADSLVTPTVDRGGVYYLDSLMTPSLECVDDMDTSLTPTVENRVIPSIDSFTTICVDQSDLCSPDSFESHQLDSLGTRKMDSLDYHQIDSLNFSQLDSLSTNFMDASHMDSLSTSHVDKCSYHPVDTSDFHISEKLKKLEDTPVQMCSRLLSPSDSLEIQEDDSLDEEECQWYSKAVAVGSLEGCQPLLDEVDQAKLRSSLSWLLSKVYGSNVPKELQDPFYQTAEGQVVLRPNMVNYMSSSELYCQACSNMFPETHAQWQGHWSIIQVLSRKGIYISDETSVTETVLVQTAPFRLKAHLALIDALMRAYIAEVASVEKVVKAVKRVTTFPASSELPSAPEEALKFWINKICTVLGTAGGDTGANGESVAESGLKSRLVKPGVPTRDPVQVPLLEDLMRDIGDGTSVAAVIAYYRPNLVNIKDLCLKDSIGIADSLYNLRQIGEFCRNHLPWKCFMVTYEDLLYTHEVMKVNILTFLADLFYFFEGPGGQVSETTSALIAAKEKIDAMPAAGRRTPLSGVANVPISSATKKSFQRLPIEDTASNLGMNRTSAISPSSHQPLLPRRTGGRRSFTQEDGQTSSPPTNRKGRRTLSLSSPQERETVHKSVLAWQDDQKIHSRSDDKRQSSEHQHGRGSLLANVSIDSTLNQSTNAENLSLDFSELDQLDTPRFSKGSVADPNHPDYMELESVTSGRPSRFASPQEPADRLTNRTPTSRLEPLIPAVLRPAKERDTNLSKAEERGDRLQRRKQANSPSHPFSPSQRSVQQPSGRSSSEDLAVSLSSSSSETTVSSLPSGESPTPRLMGQSQVPLHRPFEAFTVGTGVSQQYEDSPPNSVRSNAISTAGSYTVANSVTSLAARAAGLPIVSDSNDTTALDKTAGDRSREGSVASSGEYSDHESQKIHQDHKLRESCTPANISGNNNNGMKPAMIITDRLGTGTDSGEGGKVFIKLPQSSNTTNFAELKRLKDKLGYKIDKSCSQGGPYDQMASGDLKTTLGSPQGQDHLVPGKTSQASSPSAAPDGAVPQMNGAEPPSSDLQQLRLKLEQKRREIERKKHRQEAQQTKMRQRLGKAAFMRVVSKHLEGGEEEESAEYEDPTGRPDTLVATSTQAQIQARLGHPIQRLPLGHTARAQPVNTMPQGTLGPLIPPDTSAQRFTDWTSVSKSNQTLTSKPGHLEQQQVPGAGEAGPDSQKSGNRAFSREGIQQTIDNVKNKWFNSNSDLIAGGAFTEDDTGSYRGGSNDLVCGASARIGSRESSQSPHMGRPSYANSPVPGQSASPQVRDTSSPRPIKVEPEYQEYDSSLDKLNNSLTELQGEIMRLSLQHEQLKAAQSPVSGQPVGLDSRLDEALQAIGSTTTGASPAAPRPIQGIPQQAPYVHGSMVRSQPAMSNSFSADATLSPLMNTSQQQQPGSMTDSNRSGLSRSGHEAKPGFVLSDGGQGDQSGMDSSSEGFFIAYAEDTPKRPKPKLSDQRGRGVSPSPQSRQPPVIPLTTGQDDQAGANKASGLVTLEPHLGLADDGSPSIGFVIKDQEALSKEQEYEDEMQKKKIKLMEMQRKRKEEQEKRRLEKEAEMAKKAEEKMFKEEEQERKKAEDKARREVIFQQYLQKKQEDEEVTPTKVKVKKRDSSSGGKPRPKSMFVKSKAMTPEPGALGGMDSGSSSQEDLIGRDASGGRSTPGVMSANDTQKAMRSTYHFRLPQPTRIRKAVSCNTLQQGPSNGAQGPSTYRRPPSPDLYRIKQQRQRGNSQDSGSETGSGSNPGSDYAGPKLFVKPSAKSNRHIIVNAISHCCLAGSVNTDMKNKVLEELSKCEANHFLILFRDAGCQYKGLFIFYPETEEAFKVHGVGPKHITNKMCEKFYKYNSGAKSFMEITSTKHLSVSVDAVVLQGTVWKTGKVVVKR